jgi:hypothetical protein
VQLGIPWCPGIPRTYLVQRRSSTSITRSHSRPSLCESSTGLPALAVDRVMSETSNVAHEDHVLFVDVGRPTV